MQSFDDVRKAQKGIRRSSPASVANGAPPDSAEADAFAVNSRGFALVLARIHATRLDDMSNACELR